MNKVISAVVAVTVAIVGGVGCTSVVGEPGDTGADEVGEATQAITQVPAPEHRWSFDEGTGSVAHDMGSVGGFDGTLGAEAFFATGLAGAVGAANDRMVYTFPVSSYADPSMYVDFGTSAGAFGTEEFTVTHDLLVLGTPSGLADVLGNRTSYSHGNFFSVRMSSAGVISVELDQDASGTNYVAVVGTPVNDAKLHHLAYVRRGGTLSLYIDGTLAGSASTSTGAPTVLSGADSFRLGRRAPFSFAAIAAYFDDLRIYDHALSAEEIALIAAGGA